MKNKRTIKSLKPMIDVVLSVTVEEVVPDDLRALAVALYLGRAKEVIRIHDTYPEDHIIHDAARVAVALHSDEEVRKTYIADGFFEEQLGLILDEAKKNRVAGARLMPIFCSALELADELMLSDDLQDGIIDHIEWQRNEDGFVIRDINGSEVDVVPADDVGDTDEDVPA